MRRTWITLLLLGLVPSGLFYLLEATGCTAALGFVATTQWVQGSPSIFDFIMMFASMISWAWLRGFIYVFLLAAVPFAIGDLLRARRPS